MIKDFNALPGVKIIQEIDFKAVFEYWPEVVGDFGDALVASLAKAQRGSVLLTFDQKFLAQIRVKKLKLTALGPTPMPPGSLPSGVDTVNVD